MTFDNCVSRFAIQTLESELSFQRDSASGGNVHSPAQDRLKLPFVFIGNR